MKQPAFGGLFRVRWKRPRWRNGSRPRNNEVAKRWPPVMQALPKSTTPAVFRRANSGPRVRGSGISRADPSANCSHERRHPLHGEVMRFMRMPADVALAYDRRGCTEGRDRDRRKVSVEAAPDVDFCKLIGFAVGITAQFASFSGRAQVRFDFNQACGRCQTHCQSRCHDLTKKQLVLLKFGLCLSRCAAAKSLEDAGTCLLVDLVQRQQ